LSSIYSITLEELRVELVANQFARYSADQVYHWLYKKFHTDPTDWSNVSKNVKNHLMMNYDFFLPKIVSHAKSEDGTQKFLVQFNDKETVETVLIPGTGRFTLCISSQVGCAIGCTFCFTATMGLKRNLLVDEIVGQYLAVNKWLNENNESETRISNIVFMGQGEPLHNYKNVENAIHIFMEDKGIGLGQRKITLSTSGLVPQIKRLGDFPPVNIAISLHSVFDDIRSSLMPINNIHNLEKLFEAIDAIPLKAKRKITYEYLLIKDLNDRVEDIDQLNKMLNKRSSKINIIPFNEYPESNYKRPSDQKIYWFRDEMIKKGHVCTVRASKGRDILAACGQLKSREDKLNNITQ